MVAVSDRDTLRAHMDAMASETFSPLWKIVNLHDPWPRFGRLRAAIACLRGKSVICGCDIDEHRIEPRRGTGLAVIKMGGTS